MVRSLNTNYDHRSFVKPNGLRESPNYWLTNRKQIFGLAAAYQPVSTCDKQPASVHPAKVLLPLGDLAHHRGRK